MEKEELRKKIARIHTAILTHTPVGRDENDFPVAATQTYLYDFISQELDKAREGGRMSAMNELKRAFSKVFYKSGELWFDYLFEDGDTEAEEDAKAVVEGYWEDILSELKDKN